MAWTISRSVRWFSLAFPQIWWREGSCMETTSVPILGPLPYIYHTYTIHHMNTYNIHIPYIYIHIPCIGLWCFMALDLVGWFLRSPFFSRLFLASFQVYDRYLDILLGRNRSRSTRLVQDTSALVAVALDGFDDLLELIGDVLSADPPALEEVKTLTCLDRIYNKDKSSTYNDIYNLIITSTYYDE